MQSEFLQYMAIGLTLVYLLLPLKLYNNIALSIILNIIGSHGLSFLENLSFFMVDASGFHGSLRDVLLAGASLILSQIVLCAAFFFGTKAILDHRLNLE